jgi:hypothetical protein
VDAALAADAVGQTFEIMAPMRRALKRAPPGQGERFAFRSTDDAGYWAIRCDGPTVVTYDGPCDVELCGTASDLMLFLWQRLPAGSGSLVAEGHTALLDRYFVLVPPL